MTTEEFNALPLEARRFITDQKGCASCGQKKDLDKFYKKYLEMQKTTFFVLRNGAIPTEEGVLYPIYATDTDSILVDKLKLAVKLHTKRPEKFSTFEELRIKAYLEPVKAEKAKKIVANETTSSE